MVAIKVDAGGAQTAGVGEQPADRARSRRACVEPRNAWMRAMREVPMDDLKRATSDPSRFNVCGRLDKESRGLLMLTGGGALRGVIGGNGVTKRYVVTTDADVRESHMRSLNGRVQLDGVELLPMNVRRLGRGSRTLEFNLREGRNRQIRRVCENSSSSGGSVSRANRGHRHRGSSGRSVENTERR